MDLVVRNARVMTCDPARAGLGLVNGALAIAGGKVAAIGDVSGGAKEIDVGGRLVTPGLVDCHTHAIFAGHRAHEFELRAAGKTYLEIQEAGGGIMATLGPTRAVPDRMLELSLACNTSLMRHGGTTTMEIKSGYALTCEGELRLLRMISAVPGAVPTLLAHLVPPERRGDRDAFVREICEQWIPRAKPLARSVDVWCESAAFTLDETRQIFTAARAHGLPVRGHIGQLSDLGAALLLAEFDALSADHLEYVDDAGIAALARAGTVAVMLPGACVQLRLPPPPVEKFRAMGLRMAVATDLNPGSSYCETLPIQMWLATTHFGMTVEEAWLGVTRHAAHALRVNTGVLVPGAPADFAIWDADDPAQIPYRYGTSLVHKVFVAGLDVIAK
ncbi:MAG TPA: imidazolonepropionase [Kofleriaceae bacterium]|nr:imidazolonepropionase [Kofleriaceae bacterium]